MKDLIVFILLLITSVVLVKIFLKITSVVAKVIIWICMVFCVMYILNYYVLPILGFKPLPIKECLFQIKREEKSLEKSVDDKIKKIEEETKNLIITQKVNIKDILQKEVTTFYNK